MEGTIAACWFNTILFARLFVFTIIALFLGNWEEKEATKAGKRLKLLTKNLELKNK